MTLIQVNTFIKVLLVKIKYREKTYWKKNI